MYTALHISATGLKAQDARIQSLSQDISNFRTTGYKREEIEFCELMSQSSQENNAFSHPLGKGVKVGSIYKNFQPGVPQMTENPYDLMIDGNGFFLVQTARGEMAYLRSAAFHLDAQGNLQLRNGAKLIPSIMIPEGSTNVQISKEGEVKINAGKEDETILAQIRIVTFQNERGLINLGDGLYQATLESGEPIHALPGTQGAGVILQGALEESNVDLVSSMMDLIATQRTYEMGTRVMNVVDQMLGATANIV